MSDKILLGSLPLSLFMEKRKVSVLEKQVIKREKQVVELEKQVTLQDVFSKRTFWDGSENSRKGTGFYWSFKKGMNQPLDFTLNL